MRLSSDEESDVEAQLEAFMGQAMISDTTGPKIRESQASAEDLPRITERVQHGANMPLPKIEIFKDQNELDPVFMVEKGHHKLKKRRDRDNED